MMTLITFILALSALISFSHADDPSTEQEQTTFIDFEEVSLTAEMVKPSAILVSAERQTPKPDLLIPDVRQLFLDKQAAEHARASK